MKPINEKKEKRMIINNAKETLKGNAEALKQNYGIVVPKDILNMENGAFYVYITNTVYPVLKDVKTTDPEIMDVIAKVRACVKAFVHYYREYKVNTPAEK